MGHQELLFRSGVFAVVTLEWSVVGVRELMVEQQLLVVTSVVAKLTLEPGKYTSECFSLWWYHHINYQTKCCRIFFTIINYHLSHIYFWNTEWYKTKRLILFFQYWLAVSKTLDVGQQVHFECVPLFEGFATLQSQTDIINKRSGEPYRVHLLSCNYFHIYV